MTAQLIFWGKVPLFLINGNIAAEDVIIPTTSPLSFTNAPPEFPGCTGTVICSKDEAPSIPERELTTPSVYFASFPKTELTGKPIVNTLSPVLIDLIGLICKKLEVEFSIFKLPNHS